MEWPRVFRYGSIFILTLSLFALSSGSLMAAGRTFYVHQVNSKAGDTNPGTLEKPWKTIRWAVQEAQPGDTVYIREGVYREALIPVRSGQEGNPITFSGYQNEKAWVVGSDLVSGWIKEGNFWVKRPWIGWGYWQDDFVKVSRAPYGESARTEQVYLEGKPLQWVPDKTALTPGSFLWPKDGSELVLCLNDNQDPNQFMVEVPMRAFVVGLGNDTEDPLGRSHIRSWKAIMAPEEFNQRVKPEDLIPKNYIQIKNLNFRHNRATLNRCAVFIGGDHWVFENNLVEWTNSAGIGIYGDYAIVRNNVTRFTGQTGIDGNGWYPLVEGNISLWDNIRHYYEYWGGSGFKAGGHLLGWRVKDHFALAPIGFGIWFDGDCDKTTIEDTVVIGQRQRGGGIGGVFYEIAWNADIRNNVAFGLTTNFSPGGGSAGVTDSTSHAVKVDGNIAISCDGGWTLGSGGRVGKRVVIDEKNNTVRVDTEPYHYKAYDCLYANNLSLHDHNYSLNVEDAWSSSAESNNRFFNNTAVERIDGPAVNWAGLHIQDYERLDNYTRHAKGNKDIKSLDSAPGEVRGRVDSAFGRIVAGLVRAMPYIDETALPVAVGKVKLIRSDILRNPGADIYYLEVNPETVWILLNSQEKQELLLAGAGTGASLLNLTNGEKVKGQPEANNLLKFPVPWGVSLITGISKDSNLGRYLTVYYQVAGKTVERLRKGQKVAMMIEANNLISQASVFQLNIDNFTIEDGTKTGTLEMKPGERKRLEFKGEPLFNGLEQIESIVVTLESELFGKTSQTIRLKPVTVPKIVYLEGAKLDKPILERTLLANDPLEINREYQSVAEIRDPITGLGWQGPEDLSADIHLGWDDAHLYFLADVKDNKFKTNLEAPYEGDCVEVFLDLRGGEKSGSSEMNNLAQQFFFIPSDTKEFSKTRVTGKNTQGLESFSYRTGTGYRIIASIPWKVITNEAPVANQEIGIDFAIDDADEKEYRKAQIIWQGNSTNWQNPSLWGRAVLAEGFSLPEVLKGHLILARSGANNVDVFKNVQGKGELRDSFKIPLDGKVEEFRHFTAGICPDNQGNLFFLDGRKNRRVRVVKHGTTSTLMLVENFMGEGNEAPYQAGSGLVVSSTGYLYVTGSHFDGVKKYHYEFLADGNVKCEEVAYFKTSAGMYRPSLILSPDERFLILSTCVNDPVDGLHVIDAGTMREVDKMGSSSGYIASPSFAAFSKDNPEELFVVNDDPLLGAKDKITRTITLVEFDPKTGKLKGPKKGNLDSGNAFVVVYYKSDNPDEGTATWLSLFGDLVYDNSEKKLILFNFSFLNSNSLFIFDPAKISECPLRLEDLPPYGRTTANMAFDVVVGDF